MLSILQLRRTRSKPATNKVLPKAGLNGFDWAFVQGSTFVLRLNFCAINPPLRQAPKRWRQGTGRVIKQSYLDNGENEHRH